MGERKVLNKYYPPDFDPAKLPKLELPKERQYVVRLMAPFTMRCLTCGNYVYKGKKFNARKETAIGEKYLGIQIFRFYIRCPMCLSEITFKTDPQNEDYAVENGAYRTFQASRLADLEEERVQQEKEEEEANNPMLALENRTKESRREMDVIDALEEIRDWNARNAQVKFDELMERHLEAEKQEEAELVKREDELIKKAFSKQREIIKRLDDEEEEEDESGESGRKPPAKKPRLEGLTSVKTSTSKLKLAGLVKKQTVGKKKAVPTTESCSGTLENKSPTDTEHSEPQETAAVETDIAKTSLESDGATETVDCKSANSRLSRPDQPPPSDVPVAPSGGSLGLLSAYSDSEASSDSEGG